MNPLEAYILLLCEIEGISMFSEKELHSSSERKLFFKDDVSSEEKQA